MTAPEMVPCPLCQAAISSAAWKCPHCTADLRWCPYDQRVVGVTIQDKWVGWLRGGRKPVAYCMSCRKIIEGPRW